MKQVLEMNYYNMLYLAWLHRKLVWLRKVPNHSMKWTNKPSKQFRSLITTHMTFKHHKLHTIQKLNISCLYFHLRLKLKLFSQIIWISGLMFSVGKLTWFCVQYFYWYSQQIIKNILIKIKNNFYERKKDQHNKFLLLDSKFYLKTSKFSSEHTWLSIYWTLPDGVT